MRFLSKLYFICNISFVIAVVMRIVENLQKKNGVFTGAILTRPLESTLVIMGYFVTIGVALIFLLALLINIASKRDLKVPKWLICTNVVFLIIQCIYFFLF